MLRISRIVTDHFCWIRLYFDSAGRGLKKEKKARGVCVEGGGGGGGGAGSDYGGD